MTVASLLSVYIIWGSTYFALRLGLDGYPPFLMAGIRFLIAGGLLYGWLRARGAPRPSLPEWRAAAWLGFLLLFVGNGGVTYAEQWVSSSLAAVVVATMPLWAAVFSLAFGQRPGRQEWLGLVIGFAGIVVLNLGGELTASGKAVAVLALSPMSWALGSVWSRRLRLPPGAMGTAAEMLTAGAMMGLFGLARGERFAAVPPLHATLAIVYLIVLGSLVAFSGYTWLLRHARPALATSYAYVNPLIAIVIGLFLGGERIRGVTWVASAIIIAGVALISLGPRRQPS